MSLRLMPGPFINVLLIGNFVFTLISSILAKISSSVSAILLLRKGLDCVWLVSYLSSASKIYRNSSVDRSSNFFWPILR